MRLCSACDAQIEEGHRFCTGCGAPVPADRADAGHPEGGADPHPEWRTSDPVPEITLTAIGKGGQEGPSFTLRAGEDGQHVVGRTEGDIPFPAEDTLSPRHALLQWDRGGRGGAGQLYLSDMESLNGVYLRICEPVVLRHGDTFIAGEQILGFELFDADRHKEAQEHGGVRFSGTPLKPWRSRVVQALEHGRPGGAWTFEGPQVTLGREEGMIQFPYDRFMSRAHCRIQMDGDVARLYDEGSRNGTYIRIRDRRALRDGDYFFVGQKLFRVGLSSVDDERASR